MSIRTSPRTFDCQAATVAELVVATQGGKREAFGELFRRFQPKVLAFALERLGHFADAEELCQDVFVQAMEKIHQLRRPECFGAWVRSITARMAINRMVRASGPALAEPETLAAASAEQRTPLDAILAEERTRTLHATLKRLGPMDRQTLEAFYFQDRSLAEMSARFGAPVGTIKRRLHVARKRLAKRVEPLVAV